MITKSMLGSFIVEDAALWMQIRRVQVNGPVTNNDHFSPNSIPHNYDIFRLAILFNWEHDLTIYELQV